MFMLTEGADGLSTFESLLQKFITWVSTSGVRLIVSILILFISYKIINVFTKKLYKNLQKKKIDETISRVSTSSIRVGLKIVIFVCLIGYVGIETASLSALSASLGVGISLAVQGTLSNFAGGVIIIVMRPFKIGDYITTSGESGTVEDIKLFYTHIVTPDNKQIMIPNGSLANNVIVNFSSKPTRRVDLTFGISYDSDVELAKKVIRDCIDSCDKVMKNPEPFVKLSNLGDSSIDITLKVWTSNDDYWDVNYYLLDEVKKAFDKNGIEVPFNTFDLNIKRNHEEDKKDIA